MKYIKFLPLVLLAWLLCSCAATKRVVYFQDTYNGYQTQVDSIQELRLKPGDRVSLYIKSKSPELAYQVSLYMGYSTTSLASSSGGGLGSGMGSNGYNYGSNNGNGLYYTVTPHGDIEMPLIGYLHVEGLTRLELQALVEKELKERDLVQDAVVIATFANMTYSVLGAASPGQYVIDKDYLTIVDAIAKAGDLNLMGKRVDVKVFRQQDDGTTKVYTVNFLSADSVYASPVYFIKQNDVIYVTPNKMLVRTTMPNGNLFQTYGFWTGLFSFAMSLVTMGITFAKK